VKRCNLPRGREVFAGALCFENGESLGIRWLNFTMVKKRKRKVCFWHNFFAQKNPQSLFPRAHPK
jgi:hypothetical protein